MLLVRSIIFLVLTANAALALPLKVQSGEHDAFSRLVVYTKSPGAWDFGRVERGYELRLNSPESTYNVSEAFAFIPRTRIKNLVDLGGGRLLIDTNCDCYANVFIASGGQIVIDIISGHNSDKKNEFEKFIDAPSASLEAGGAIGTDDIKAQTDPTHVRLGLPLFPMGQRDPADVTPNISATSFEGQHSEKEPEEEMDLSLGGPSPQQNQTPSARVKETELALIEHIGRAAAQGLVDANLSTLETEVARVTRPIESMETTSPAPEPEFEPIENLDANAHIAVQTSIDRESASQRSERVSTQEGFDCLPDAHFDIASWGGDVQAGVDLAKHRSGFLGEFDRPDGVAVTAAVRHLVYATFGAEAKALTQYYFEIVDGANSLVQMAEIMDGMETPNASKVAPQMGCDGKTSLWAALAQPEFRPGQEINKRAIISSFSKLPLHLRRHLGPSLAQKFLDLGDTKTAISLRNIVGRAKGDHGPNFQFLEAQIDLENGDPQKAEKRLTEIVNDDTEMSPTAALNIVKSRLSQKQEIPKRMIELVSTYAFEQQETPLGQELNLALVQAMSRNGEFSDAYSEIEQGTKLGRLSKMQAAQLTQVILSDLVTHGTDVDFLRYTVGATVETHVIDVDLRKAIAERLIGLGFADQARIILDVEGVIPDEKQRLLFAKIALADEKPNVALGYLAGLGSDDADRLRAEALSKSRDYKASLGIYEQLDDQRAQDQAAWRAGDWTRLATGQEGSISAASQMMLAVEENEQSEEVGILARNSELLRNSESTRDIMQGLLKQFPSP